VPWFKVDDRLATHTKVAKAGNAAMGLWVRAGSWAALHLTDGVVPEHVLPMLGTRSEARRLVVAGLWESIDGGWRFRDWHDYQPSAEDTELAKESKSSGGKHGNHERWHVKKNVFNPSCEFCLGASK
jgi:hypothetical protein